MSCHTSQTHQICVQSTNQPPIPLSTTLSRTHQQTSTRNACSDYFFSPVSNFIFYSPNLSPHHITPFPSQPHVWLEEAPKANRETSFERWTPTFLVKDSNFTLRRPPSFHYSFFRLTLHFQLVFHNSHRTFQLNERHTQSHPSSLPVLYHSFPESVRCSTQSIYSLSPKKPTILPLRLASKISFCLLLQPFLKRRLVSFSTARQTLTASSRSIVTFLNRLLYWLQSSYRKTLTHHTWFANWSGQIL